MTSTISQLLRDQALSSAVKHYIRDVIRTAAITVQSLKPINGQDSGMRESQLRNVVSVAIGAQSVEEIAAFILYQMGRRENSRQWQFGQFGDHVVADLMRGSVQTAARNAQTMALEIIGRGADQVSVEEQQRILDEAYIALARQYLGYLNRLFSFAERTQRWDELGQMAGEQTA